MTRSVDSVHHRDSKRKSKGSCVAMPSRYAHTIETNSCIHGIVPTGTNNDVLCITLECAYYPRWRFSQTLFLSINVTKTRQIVVVSRPDRSPRPVILVISVVPTLLPRQLLEDNDSTPISLANGQCVLNAWFSPVAVPQLLRWARSKDLR